MAEHLLKGYARLSRGVVWCVQCGATLRVDPARCLATGWPMCHGQTMTIDSPEERAESDRERGVNR